MKTTAALALLGAIGSAAAESEFGRKLQSTDYVQVIFPNGISSQFAGAFTDAAAFWNDVLTTAPVNPVVFSSSFNVATQTSCGVNFVFPAGSRITGLTIFADVSPIDGVNGILGQAGPCAFTQTTNFIFPRLGSMQFDTADVQAMLNAGQLDEVIRHEMGHVLGIGSLWSSLGLLKNPCSRLPCTTNPQYTGVNGRTGLSQLGGGTGNIPVENTGGQGTFNSHWRETTFANELMTGFLNNGVNPVSIMTIRSLIDMGYNVDVNTAEAYSLPKEGDEVVAGETDMSGDIKLFEMVDLDSAVASNEAEHAGKAKSHEFVVLAAVVGTVLTVLSALVVFLAMRITNQNKDLAVEMKATNAGTVNPMSGYVPTSVRTSMKKSEDIEA